MVSQIERMSATELAGRLRSFLERGVGPDNKPLSQREVFRRLRVPRTTVQDFLANPEGRRASTVARIAEALQSSALQVPREGLRTIRVDAPVFTRESLRAVTRPDNARGFQFVYQNDQYETGYGQTLLSDTFSENPEDMADLVPGGAGNIVSVVWYKG